MAGLDGRKRALATTVSRAALALLAAGLAPGAAAQTVEWTAGDGVWDNAANWNPGLPGAPNDVVIDVDGGTVRTITFRQDAVSIQSLRSEETLNFTGGSLTVAGPFQNSALTSLAGTLTLNGASTLAAFTQTAGLLDGSGTVRVTGAAALNGGRHGGSGETRLEGGATIGTLFSIADTRRILVTGGMTTGAGFGVSFAGATGGASTATLVNAAGSTFADQATATGSFAVGSGLDGLFDNQGIYLKTGTGQTRFAVRVENSGLLDLRAGTARFEADSNHSGAIAIASGAVLEFAGGTHSIAGPNVSVASGGLVRMVSGGATFTGATALGAVTVQNGTLTLADAGSTLDALTISGGTFVFGGDDMVASLALSGGTLRGTGTLRAAATTLSGSSFMSDAGTTILDGPVTASGNLNVNNGRVLEIAGGLMTSSFNITTSAFGGPIGFVRNRAGSIWTDNGAGPGLSVSLNTSSGPTSTAIEFENLGTYRKTGAGTTRFNTPMLSSGAIELQAGTLQVMRPFTSTGTLAIGGTAILELGANATLGGTVTAAAGSLLRVTGGTVDLTVPAALGAVEVSGGRLQVQNAATGFQSIATSGIGELRYDGTATLATLSQANGSTLTGTSQLTVTGTATLQGGSQSGAGQTIVTGATSLSGFFNLADGRVLTIAGGAAAGTGIQLNLDSSAGAGFGTLRNLAGSTFDLSASGSSFVTSSTGQGLFDNQGLFVKAGAGRATFSAALVNSGTIDMRGGTLSLRRAGAAVQEVGGALLIGPAATLDLSGSYAIATLDQSGGTIDALPEPGLATGLGNLTVRGAASLTGGGQTGNGTTTIEGLASFGASYTLADRRTLVLAGGGVSAAQFAFDLDASAASGAGTLRIAAGQSFVDNTAAGNASGIASGTAGGQLLNDGSYRHLGGGATTVGASFTNAGTVAVEAGGDLVFTGPVTNLANETLTGGVWRVLGSGSELRFESGAGNAIRTNAADVTLSGAGSVLRSGNPVALETTLATNAAAGVLRIRDGRDYVATANGGAVSNAGLIELTDGRFGATTLANSGTVSGFGALGGTTVNTGLVLATGGTLTADPVTGLTGTVRIASGATLDLSGGGGDSSAGLLDHQGAGLALGGRSITVRQDYQNAAFGSGDAFDARRNVTGGGLILAEDAGQMLTGAGVSDGGSATPTIAIGNIRIGDSVTRAVSVENTGSLTTLRGTTLTGGAPGLTVTGGGDFVLAPGQAQALDFGFTGARAGALDGQSIRVANNFDNVADQTIQLTGAVFATANPILAADLDFGAVRTGTVQTRTITVENRLLAGVLPGFQEGLNASFGSVASGFSGTGAITNLGAGGSDSTTLVVTLDTTSAGMRRGTVEVRLASNGDGTSGLGLLDLGSQTLIANAAVDAVVFRMAAPEVTAPTGRITARVGDTATRAIRIANIAPADGFSESLGVTGSVGGSGIAFSNADGLIAAGAARTVTATVDTRFAGSRSATLALALTSDGTGTSGAPAVALPGQAVTIDADVYAAAVAGISTPVLDFGVVRVGYALPLRSIQLANDAQAPLADTLVTTIGAAPAGFTPGAAPGPLAAGSGGRIEVRMATGAAGRFSGPLALDFVSRNPVLADLALARQTVQLTGTVNNRANAAFARAGTAISFDASAGAYVLDAGTLRLGAPVTLDGLTIVNQVSGPADALSGSVSDADPTDIFRLAGPITVSPLAAGAASAAFGVGVDTSQIGQFSGEIRFSGVGTNASDPVGEARTARLVLRARVARLGLLAPADLDCAGRVGLDAANAALDAAAAPASLVAAINALAPANAAPANETLARIGPEAYASARYIAQENGLVLADALRGVARPGEARGWSGFAQALRGDRNVDGDDCACTSDVTATGVIGGLQYEGERFAAAVFIGAIDANQQLRARAASTEANGLVAGVRAAGRIGGFDLAATLAYDGSDATTRRASARGTQLQSSRFDLGGWTGDLSLSRGFDLGGGVGLAPRIGVTWSALERDAAGEAGDPLALTVARETENVWHADAGATFTGTLGGGDDPLIRPSLTLGVRHQVAGARATADAGFAAAPALVRIVGDGAPQGRTRATLGAGLEAELGQRIRLSARYLGEFGSGATRAAATLGLTLGF